MVKTITFHLRDRISPDEQYDIYKAYKHGWDVAAIMLSFRVTYKKFIKILVEVGEFEEDDFPAEPTKRDFSEAFACVK